MATLKTHLLRALKTRADHEAAHLAETRRQYERAAVAAQLAATAAATAKIAPSATSQTANGGTTK